METPLAVAEVSSPYVVSWGEVITMPPGGRKAEIKPGGFPPW